MPVEIPQRKGDPVVVSTDEGIRPRHHRGVPGQAEAGVPEGGTDHRGQRLADLRRRRGGRRDDAARPSRAWGSTPIAEIVAHGMCAERYAYLHTVPAIAMQNALKKAGKDVHDLGLLEINEAFASVSLNAARMLGVGRGHRERERRRGGARPPDRRHAARGWC